MSARSGRRIGRYTLKSTLGRGGMGVVWRAWDEQLKREVALKLLLAKRVSATHAERFRREAEAVARIQHPNVIRIHDAGQHGSELFLVMELIEGGSLQQRLDQRGPLNPRVAAEWVAQLADALGAAHAAGVLHRDVKPDNVLLRASGEPLLTDFGLAVHEADERLTQTGLLVGTPGYLAPEQGAGGATDARADLYALGAVLFACLTGEPPAGRVGALQLLAASERVPDPPSLRVSTVPAALDRICLRCLQPRPDKRYSSMQELARELRRFLDCHVPPRSGGKRLGLGAAGATLAGALAWVLIGGPEVATRNSGVGEVASSAVPTSSAETHDPGAASPAQPAAGSSGKPAEDSWGSWDEARVAGGRLIALGRHEGGITALEFALAAEPPLRNQLQIGHDLVRALCQSRLDPKRLELARQRVDRAEALVAELERRVGASGDTLAMTALQFGRADLTCFVELRHCEILHAEGELDAALERAQSLAVRFSDSLRIAQLIAECLLQKRAFQEALDHAEEYMALYPKHEANKTLLSCCYEACDKLGRGGEQDDYARRLANSHTSTWFFRHVLHADERGDFAQATERFLRLQEEQRANPTRERKLALMRLGFLLGGKRAQDAEAASMREIKRDPGCVEALLVAGETHLLWGQPERTLKEAEAALLVDGNLAAARVLRACALAGLQRYEDSVKEARLALNLDPQLAHRSLVWEALSVSLRTLDRDEEHAALLEEMATSPVRFWRHVAEEQRGWAKEAAEAEGLR